MDKIIRVVLLLSFALLISIHSRSQDFIKGGGSYTANQKEVISVWDDFYFNERTSDISDEELAWVEAPGSVSDFNLYIAINEEGTLLINGRAIQNAITRGDTLQFVDVFFGPFMLNYVTLEGEESLQLALSREVKGYMDVEGNVYEVTYRINYQSLLNFKKRKQYKIKNRDLDSSRLVHEVPMLMPGTYLSKFEEDNDEGIKRRLNADKVLFGYGGGDGMRLVRNRETQKWGIYQCWGEDCTEFIPMDYDSLRSFQQNAWFTAVYNNGKVGFYLAAWSFGDQAKQTVPCEYDNFKIVEDTRSYPFVPYLAVEKGGKWAWVDWLTGALKSDYVDELSSIPFEQKLSFDEE